jgi:hypothetical protein
MAPPLLVDPLEIGMPQQSPAARILLPSLPLQIRRSLGSKRAHGSLTIRLRMLCKSLRMTTLWDPRARPGREIDVLLAEAGLHRDPLATLRAPARQHRGSALGLHARSESVLLRALTPVRLESALGHEKSLLLIRSMAFRQTVSINDAPRTRQTDLAADCNSSHRIPRCNARKNFLAPVTDSCLISFAHSAERALSVAHLVQRDKIFCAENLLPPSPLAHFRIPPNSAPILPFPQLVRVR